MPAVGGGGGIPGPPGSGGWGTKWRNIVTDHGADPTGGTAGQEVHVQAAIDALYDPVQLAAGKANSVGFGGTVFLPSGNYLISRPIWLDADNVYPVGERKDTTQITSQFGGPNFILGTRRRAAWNATLRSDENLSACGGTSVSFTNGSATVVGNGTTKFTTLFGSYLTGAPLWIKDGAGAWARVSSVTDDTHLVLTAPYGGTTNATSTAVHRGSDYTSGLPTIFAADHRVDAWNGGSPKLDNGMTGGGNPNRRAGLRGFSVSGGSPFADHWVSWPVSGPGLGVNFDCWDTIRTFTLDINLDPRPGFNLETAICGLGSSGSPMPWVLEGRTGKYQFLFYTKEGVRNSSNQQRSFTFGDTTGSTQQRVAVQIDFTHNTDGSTGTSALCSIRAWVNGVEQTITRGYGTQLTTATGTEPSFTAGDGLHWQSAEPGGCFSLFDDSSSGKFWGSPSNPSLNRGAFTCYGLRLSNAIRYTTSGGVQARVDNGALYSIDNSTTNNDQYRYDHGTDTTSMIGAIDTTPTPTADYAGRLVPWVTGPAMSGQVHYGLFLFDTNEAPYGGPVLTHGFEKLTVQAGVGGGVSALVNFDLMVTIQDVYFLGNGSGIAIGGVAPSVYDVIIDRCRFNGHHVAWVAEQGGWILFVDTTHESSDVFRYAIRLDGADAKLHNIRSSGTSGTECYIKITGTSGYGSEYEIDGLFGDNEGAPEPTVATILCERSAGAPFTSLSVKNVTIGNTAAWAPTVKLVDRWTDAGTGPGLVHISDCQHVALGVMTDGPSWQGTVDGMHLFQYDTMLRLHTGTDGASNVVSLERMDALPTRNIWHKNARRITIRHPAPGASDTYVVSTSGVATWSAATAYHIGDLVWLSGAVYQATANNTNSSPPSANWTAVPAWSGVTAYTAGNIVSSSGSLWQATAASTNVTPAQANASPWLFLGPVAQAMFAPVTTLGTPVSQ